MSDESPRPTPWWRRVAAYLCLGAIMASALWFYRLADRADPAATAAATPGYSVTLIVFAGCMVALLIGVYDVARLKYLAQVHESTVSAVAKTDADLKVVRDSNYSGGY